MTFKHKLSRRLALIHDAMAAMLVALIAACTPGDRSLSPVQADVTPPPAGTLLFSEHFEDTAFASRGWYDNTSMVTTTAQHLPTGSTRAAEMHFLAGATTPVNGGAARHLFTPTPTLYVSLWVKYSSNWVGSGRPYHPHEFLILSDLDGDWDGPSNNWLTAYIEDNYQNGGIPRLALQDNKAINTTFGALPNNLVGVTESRSVAGCNGVVEMSVVTTCFNMPPWYNDKEFSASQVWFQPAAGSPGYKGDWNHVEVYLQLNNVVGGIGQADGVMQYWFNGTLAIDRHDVLFRTGARPTIQFHQFTIAPYIGDGSPVDQYMWIDDLTVATGPLSSQPPPSPPPAPGTPGTVSDLAVTGVSDTSVTLAFTEVGDGAGQPASYDVRLASGTIAFGSASDVTLGTCKVPMAGTTIGAKHSCTVLGLTPATAYQFQLVAFRGTLNIDAVFGGPSNVASGTTAQKPVASVTVSPVSATVYTGTTKQLAVVLKDAAGNTLSGRTVTWTSSAPAVATVSSSGLATGMAAGSATITATSEGMKGTAAVTDANPAKPGKVTTLAVSAVTDTSVTLTFTEVSDGAGNPASYDVRYKTGTFNWSSASDVSRGTCKVPMAGTAIGAKRSCTVLGLTRGTAYGLELVAFRGTLNVNAVFGALSNLVKATTSTTPVASVTVSPASASLTVGATQQLAAVLKDAVGNTLTGRTITWASSNTAVATVSGSGLVTAVAAGSATITATSETKSGTATFTVTAPAGNPGAVSDLAVTDVTGNSVTLSFTEVTDGAGQPAEYDARFAAGTIAFGSASDVTVGTCAVPMAGTTIGAKRSCTVGGLTAGTTYQFQLVAFRGTLNVDAVFGALSNVASGTTSASSAPVATVTVTPASASVVVGAVQQYTAVLKDVSGNTLTGRTVTWASSLPGVASVSGTGLVTALVVGSATITATSEGVSGTATVTVTAAPSGGIVFQSDWTSGTGTGAGPVQDGGRWMNYWEFNNNTGVLLMSVVPGGPAGYANSLKVLQRGSTFAANVQQDNVVPPSTDYYVRYYMRNDDTSPAGDHIVTVDTWLYDNLTYMRKMGSATGWTFVSSFYGCGYTYPIGHWGPSRTMTNGAWYRFEYWVHFVDATHVQVHPRVYDASGTQILGDADFQQSDFGGATWNGRSDWTLASYYAAGYSFCVNPSALTHFGMGNNGQQGAVDTGLAWYFAGVQIRTDRWPGP